MVISSMKETKHQKIYHHDHTAGAYVGAAHTHCDFFAFIHKDKPPYILPYSQGYARIVL